MIIATKILIIYNNNNNNCNNNIKHDAYSNVACKNIVNILNTTNESVPYLLFYSFNLHF